MLTYGNYNYTEGCLLVVRTVLLIDARYFSHLEKTVVLRLRIGIFLHHPDW